MIYYKTYFEASVLTPPPPSWSTAALQDAHPQEVCIVVPILSAQICA